MATNCPCPKFFKDGKIDSGIRDALLFIADDILENLEEKLPGFKELDIVDHIVFTGSFTGTGWDDQSDVDLHFIVDFGKIEDETEVNFLKFGLAYFSKIYSENNYKIKGSPIEVYFQDKDEPHYSPGVYDLKANEWLEEPDCDPIEVSQEEKQKSDEYLTKIKELSKSQLSDDIDGYKKEIDDLFEEIKDQRAEGLASKETYRSSGNIIFKLLRRNGGLGSLDKLKKRIKQLEISEYLVEMRKIFRKEILTLMIMLKKEC